MKKLCKTITLNNNTNAIMAKVHWQRAGICVSGYNTPEQKWQEDHVEPGCFILN